MFEEFSLRQGCRFTPALEALESRTLLSPAAALVGQPSVLYHAVLLEGTSFTQRFTLKNTGDTTWSGCYLVRVGASDALGGGANAIPVPTATPGGTVTVSLPLQAKKGVGLGAVQLGEWQLRTGPTTSSSRISVNGSPTGDLWTAITITPNVSGPGIPRLNYTGYTSTANPYVNVNYGGQCTAFVWGRANEQLGLSLGVSSAAGQGWVTALTGAGKPYTIDMIPKANSIAVWKDAYGGGHVAYVEWASGTGNTAQVTITEANWRSYKSWASTHDLSGKEWGGGYDGSPVTLTHSGIVNRSTGYTFLGYIHLA